MYSISFSPALGDAITIESSSLVAQSTTLQFTAQLSTHDYDQLVRDGGRVQLWSDILRQDEDSDAWGEADFEDPVPPFSTIPLVGGPPSEGTAHKTLYLSTSLPPSNSGTRRFSFTYRIAYSSGDIMWLGAFGQDGVLTLNQSQSEALEGIHLHPGWTTEATRHSRVLEIKDGVKNLEIAKLNNLSDFRLCAMSPQSHTPQLGDVSLLFLVPLSQQCPHVLSPTYVVAVSPGLTLSVVEGQTLTISGSGTALLQVHDPQINITTFVERLIAHTKLDDWKLLSIDTKGKAFTLALTTQEQPVHAVRISLLPSKYTNANIYLNRAQLANLYTTRDTDEFALFLPRKNQLLVFDKNSNEQEILIEDEYTGGVFTISPIYRIPAIDKPGRQLRRNWGATILTPYNRLSFPFFLTNDTRIRSTSPASPREPTACFSPVSCASTETMLSSITSLPSNASISSRKDDFDHVDELQNICTDDDDIMLSPTAPTNHPITPRSILSLFKSIFVSVGATIVHFFFRVFWDPILPFVTSHSQQHTSIQECDDRQIETSDQTLTEEILQGSLLDKGYSSLSGISPENRVQTAAGTTPEDEDGDVSQDIDDPDSTFLDVKIAKPSGSSTTDNNILFVDDLGPPARSTAGVEIFYAEVSGNEVSGRATTAIVLLPPMANDGDQEVIDATSVSSFNGLLQQAVKFLDGSHPRCVISRVNLFTCDSLAQKQQIESGQNICYLLEYLFDRTDDKPVKTISISSPGGSLV